jgi:hypothetical protein
MGRRLPDTLAGGVVRGLEDNDNDKPPGEKEPDGDEECTNGCTDERRSEGT